MKKPLVIVILVVVVLGIAVGISKAVPSAPVDEQAGDRLMSIEDYVRLNISELSPVKEQVGGKFFVTDIEAENGEGTVEYEDGHNAYVADFTYTANDERGYSVTSFIIRE